MVEGVKFRPTEEKNQDYSGDFSRYTVGVKKGGGSRGGKNFCRLERVKTKDTEGVQRGLKWLENKEKGRENKRLTRW